LLFGCELTIRAVFANIRLHVHCVLPRWAWLLLERRLEDALKDARNTRIALSSHDLIPLVAIGIEDA
jgi:hypothetical protein